MTRIFTECMFKPKVTNEQPLVGTLILESIIGFIKFWMYNKGINRSTYVQAQIYIDTCIYTCLTM